MPQLPAADVTTLIKAGCFDALEGCRQRPRLIWRLLDLHQRPAERDNGQLFIAEPPPSPTLPAYDQATLHRQELETLGLPVARHPLEPFAAIIRNRRLIPASDLKRWVGRHVTLAGWWVTGKPIRTGKGQPMEFATFEDATALFDATFFPAAYARFCKKLGQPRPYLIKGVVEEEFGVATVNVMWLGFLDEEDQNGKRRE
nr:hypothetical protein [Syntrophotalea acetylenica]